MYHQFKIQQLYALPTLYLFVLYYSENKQRLVPLKDKLVGIYKIRFDPLQHSGHYMYHQFKIQLQYALSTLYLCVLYLSQD